MRVNDELIGYSGKCFASNFKVVFETVSAITEEDHKAPQTEFLLGTS
jgi:hypothetical protein